MANHVYVHNPRACSHAVIDRFTSVAARSGPAIVARDTITLICNKSEPAGDEGAHDGPDCLGPGKL